MPPLNKKINFSERVHPKVKRWLKKLEEVKDVGYEVMIVAVTPNGHLQGGYQEHTPDGFVSVRTIAQGKTPNGNNVGIPMIHEFHLADVQIFGFQVQAPIQMGNLVEPVMLVPSSIRNKSSV